MLFTLYDDMIESITLLSLFVVLWVGAGQMGWEFFGRFKSFNILYTLVVSYTAYVFNLP